MESGSATAAVGAVAPSSQAAYGRRGGTVPPRRFFLRRPLAWTGRPSRAVASDHSKPKTLLGSTSPTGIEELRMITEQQVRTVGVAGGNGEVRPFRVEIADESLEDLRRRIAATRLPSRELVDDRSQGVQLATIKEV